ncbi:arylsulfatase [Cryobacterium tagatosivorans]|uniref:Arylsulfatase n=1 Tax=Cryobacterium tagatosivorans TaxID=1259199 RepID=A0A4R8UG73_9MICO|nr:arylsulfatase [Cryobacterium tagatosivorans]TFB51065.1 arylsulfatase [Cryobacterium tagatosivorans]
MTQQTGETYRESTPAWRSHGGRPGAPNVVVVVLDDVGFGQLGCYGSSIETPTIDAIAAEGVRYSNFHVTPLCSPTRASLLTGRNHHSVGMGFIAGFDTGYDAYRGHMRAEAATLARMLKDDGYGTYAVGKWHLTPSADMTAAGPFEHWPLGRGFDRYYGFLWGEEDHFEPQLWEDNHVVDPPRRESYHLSDDLADRAIQYLGDHVSAAPERPFMLYLAFGAGHAPHQAPRDEIDRYAGRFDEGWDVERQRVFERQREMGVVPDGTVLPENNPDVRPWAELDDDARRLYARMNEVFAGYMTHADRALGRVVEFLEEIGSWDNTVVVLLSDNGATGQGGPDGTINEYRYMLGVPDSLENNLQAYDDLGGPLTHGVYPSGWAQAGNTPLRFYKKDTYAGGVRTPMILRLPGRPGPAGQIRDQFHHAIDVVPTLLEACGVEPKPSYDGVDQQPIHGTSMSYTLDAVDAPTRRPRQYFEMAGNRAMWMDGWKALTSHETDAPYRGEKWQLFRLDEDFAEASDVAEQNPDVVARLEDAWWEESRRFGVLPLDDRRQRRALEREPAASRARFRLRSGTRVFSPITGPNFSDRSFTIGAELDGAADHDGVILAYGRRPAGFVFFVREGRLHLDYNRVYEHTILAAPDPLPARRCRVEADFERLERGRARVRLLVDGHAVVAREIETLLGGFGGLSTQVGHNSPSPVSSLYDAPFRLDGLREVEITFHDPAPEPNVEDELRLE